MSLSSLSLAALAAAVGGAINSIAGGGTLLTFPTIVALGVTPLTANVTNTLALWPGTLGSAWGYRRHLGPVRPLVPGFSIASLVGGGLGGWLLLATGERMFEELVPFLVLAATVLFMVQGPLLRWLRRDVLPASRPPASPPSRPSSFPPLLFVAQLAVAIYGGYFGAGIGIMMLAALGLMGLTDIHQMNALKTWGAGLVNLIAAGLFTASGLVDWPLGLAMAAGSLLGGYGGARLAQKVAQVWVRRAVSAIGVTAFVFLLWNQR
jgi:uncharacterized membrane protein YfcA